jgi:hypothetical protein
MPTQSLSPNFLRREDLTLTSRLRIASQVSLFPKHGAVSQISCKYNVSRQFIYVLKKDFEEMCASLFNVEHAKNEDLKKKTSLAWILSLRLEGKCPIEGISSILKRFNLPYNSVGFISERLNSIGSKQREILEVCEEAVRVVFCSDEIFSKGAAILLTVDPISLAILKIELSENRKGETWESHWSSLLAEGYIPVSLCNDEGTGMASAQKKLLPTIERQSDTFHAVAHRLGAYKERFEKAALSSIAQEYDCERLLENAKTDKVYEKRFDTYSTAKSKAYAGIVKSDMFTFLYHCLLEAFNIFDDYGNLINANEALADFDTAIEMMKSLGDSEISKELKSIETCKPNLFQFRAVAQQTMSELSASIAPDLLKPICLAWQAHKNANKAKNTDRKNSLKRKEQHILTQLEYTMPHISIQQSKQIAYAKLDKIVQSSSAVECVNSILRPYLNASKNQITQPTLNLIAKYHNHRRFKAGKRKGKTPVEILTGKEQVEDWIDILLKNEAA